MNPVNTILLILTFIIIISIILIVKWVYDRHKKCGTFADLLCFIRNKKTNVDTIFELIQEAGTTIDKGLFV
jgi:hypothetical protein